MKRNISKMIFELLKSKGILAISGGLLVVSCSTQIGAYTETDGVYYDPSKDTFPETVEGYAQTNQVDEHYNYGEESAYEKSIKHGRYGSGRYTYKQEEELGSDWGNYIGTETYYNNWGGYYSPYSWGNFGWGLGFGYGWNSYFQLSYGWNSPWYGYGWGGYYNPYWNRFNFYNPYHIGGYYDPFYYGSYYRAVPRYNYRRSGTDNTPLMRNGIPTTTNRSGFRNGNIGYNNTQSNQRLSNNVQRGGFRNAPQSQANRSYQTQPSRSYNNTERHNNNSGWRNSNSNSRGFRSSGFNSGSSNSGFGGGATRSGSSGGFRSGGFR